MPKKSAEATGPGQVPSLVEKGLASYGRGQIDQALQIWREVLALDPGNEDARRLVSVVEDRRAQSGAVKITGTPEPPAAGAASTARNMNDAVKNAVDAAGDRRGSGQELERTAEWMLPADHALGGDGPLPPRNRAETPASGIPALLAPGTRAATAAVRAGPSPPRPVTRNIPATREFREPTRANFAPVATNTSFPPAHPGTPEPVVDSVTRPIGTERARPPQRNAAATTRPTQTFRTDTPLDLALATARTRAVMFVEECRRSLAAGEIAKAAAAAEEALEEGDKAPMPGIADVIQPARAMFSQAFETHVGPEVGVPMMAINLSAASTASFDHRTGFLLSCIDGSLPVQTLLDIAGMARFDSLRTLSGLLRRRIIKF